MKTLSVDNVSLRNLNFALPHHLLEPQRNNLDQFKSILLCLVDLSVDIQHSSEQSNPRGNTEGAPEDIFLIFKKFTKTIAFIGSWKLVFVSTAASI